jgi:hypothetical protein
MSGDLVRSDSIDPRNPPCLTCWFGSTAVYNACMMVNNLAIDLIMSKMNGIQDPARKLGKLGRSTDFMNVSINSIGTHTHKK